ncbi:MAG TPA: glycine reductase, partial [Chloroflexi bacterium]|nr:glycine reductase [Chloroflexota bacterium]
MTSRPVPVIKAARFFVAHTPGLVRYGSKPVRELKNDRDLDGQLAASLRSFDDA